eukprot:jgi/Mesvir1/5439/Mv15498-RA.1
MQRLLDFDTARNPLHRDPGHLGGAHAKVPKVGAWAISSPPPAGSGTASPSALATPSSPGLLARNTWAGGLPRQPGQGLGPPLGPAPSLAPGSPSSQPQSPAGVRSRAFTPDPLPHSPAHSKLDLGLSQRQTFPFRSKSVEPYAQPGMPAPTDETPASPQVLFTTSLRRLTQRKDPVVRQPVYAWTPTAPAALSEEDDLEGTGETSSTSGEGGGAPAPVSSAGDSKAQPGLPGLTKKLPGGWPNGKMAPLAPVTSSTATTTSYVTVPPLMKGSPLPAGASFLPLTAFDNTLYDELAAQHWKPPSGGAAALIATMAPPRPSKSGDPGGAADGGEDAGFFHRMDDDLLRVHAMETARGSTEAPAAAAWHGILSPGARCLSRWFFTDGTCEWRPCTLIRKGEAASQQAGHYLIEWDCNQQQKWVSRLNLLVQGEKLSLFQERQAAAANNRRRGEVVLLHQLHVDAIPLTFAQKMPQMLCRSILARLLPYLARRKRFEEEARRRRWTMARTRPLDEMVIDLITEISNSFARCMNELMYVAVQSTKPLYPLDLMPGTGSGPSGTDVGPSGTSGGQSVSAAGLTGSNAGHANGTVCQPVNPCADGAAEGGAAASTGNTAEEGDGSGDAAQPGTPVSQPASRWQQQQHQKLLVEQRVQMELLRILQHSAALDARHAVFSALRQDVGCAMLLGNSFTMSALFMITEYMEQVRNMKVLDIRLPLLPPDGKFVPPTETLFQFIDRQDQIREDVCADIRTRVRAQLAGIIVDMAELESDAMGGNGVAQPHQYWRLLRLTNQLLTMALRDMLARNLGDACAVFRRYEEAYVEGIASCWYLDDSHPTPEMLAGQPPGPPSSPSQRTRADANTKTSSKGNSTFARGRAYPEQTRMPPPMFLAKVSYGSQEHENDHIALNPGVEEYADLITGCLLRVVEDTCDVPPVELEAGTLLRRLFKGVQECEAVEGGAATNWGMGNQALVDDATAAAALGEASLAVTTVWYDDPLPPERTEFPMERDDPVLTETLQVVQSVLAHNVQLPGSVLAALAEYEYLLDPDGGGIYVQQFREKGLTLQEWEQVIQGHAMDAQDIMLKLPGSIPAGLVLLDIQALKESLSLAAQALRQLLLGAIESDLQALVVNADQQLKAVLALLTKESTCLEDVYACKKAISEVPGILTSLRGHLTGIENRMAAVDRAHFLLADATVSSAWRVMGMPLQMMDICERRNYVITKEEEFYQEQLVQMRERFMQEISELQAEVDAWNNHSNMDAAANLSGMASTLLECLEGYAAEGEKINAKEVLCGWKPTPFTNLQPLIDQMRPYAEMWKMVSEYQQLHSEWLHGPLKNIDVAHMELKLPQWLNATTKLGRVMGGNEDGKEPLKVVHELRRHVEELSTHMPLVLHLRTPGLKERHWAKIALRTGFPTDFKRDMMTLEMLLSMGMQDHLDTLSEIAAIASKELSVEMALQAMIHEIGQLCMRIERRPRLRRLGQPEKEADVSGAAGKVAEGADSHASKENQNTVFVLRNQEAIMEALDDALLKTQSLLASPYARSHEVLISSWERDLTFMQDVLEMRRSVEVKWMQLEPLFQSENLHAHMPDETKQFAQADGTWTAIMLEMMSTKQLVGLVQKKHLMVRLVALDQQLEAIVHCVGVYLAFKRDCFSRFAFLSNDELIDVLSGMRQLAIIMPLLVKCFAGPQELVLGGKRELLQGGADHLATLAAQGRPATASEEATLALLRADPPPVEDKRQGEAPPGVPAEALPTPPSPGDAATRLAGLKLTRTTTRKIIPNNPFAGLGFADSRPVTPGAMEDAGHRRPHLSDADAGPLGGNWCILGMRSALGETLKFTSPVPLLTPDGSSVLEVEDWLRSCELMMAQTLETLMTEAMFAHTISDWEEWVLGWPAQIVHVVHEVHMARQAAQCLSLPQPLVALRKLLATQDTKVNRLLRVLRDAATTPLERSVIGALATLAVHQGDVLRRLMVRKPGMGEFDVVAADEFEWMSLLQYKLEGGKLTLQTMGASFSYGYEYLGNSNRVVITPLTERCFHTLLMAMQLQRAGSPEGISGTGKTETVRALAKALARFCLVLNCSEGLDVPAMARFLKGVISGGVWACFSLFNRIELEVLSVVGHMVATVFTAKASRVPKFEFEGQSVPLKPECAIHVTMNFGLTDRKELPDNVRVLLRPVAMLHPHVELIAEVMLYSAGFTDSHRLGSRLATCFQLCAEQLSRQDHYNFGLRTLRAVLAYTTDLFITDVAAGRQPGRGGSTSAFPNNATAAARQLVQKQKEAEMCRRGLLHCIMPSLVAADVNIFVGMLDTLFAQQPSLAATTATLISTAAVAPGRLVRELSTRSVSTLTPPLGSPGLNPLVVGSDQDLRRRQSMDDASPSASPRGAAPGSGWELEVTSAGMSIAFKRACEELKLTPTESFVRKGLQLHSLMQVRHGVMAFGETGSGKTSLLKSLARALGYADASTTSAPTPRGGADQTRTPGPGSTTPPPGAKDRKDVLAGLGVAAPKELTRTNSGIQLVSALVRSNSGSMINTLPRSPSVSLPGGGPPPMERRGSSSRLPPPVEGMNTITRQPSFVPDASRAVVMHVINPKSVTVGELLGYYDPVSHQWFEGLLVKVLRDCAPSPTPGPGEGSTRRTTGPGMFMRHSLASEPPRGSSSRGNAQAGDGPAVTGRISDARNSSKGGLRRLSLESGAAVDMVLSPTAGAQPQRETPPSTRGHRRPSWDGVNSGEDAGDGRQQKHWLVLDGPVDSGWMESLHSLLDDNRKLTTSSGETLLLPPGGAVIFEVDSLRGASPGMVSSCGMVYMDDRQMGWRVLLPAFKASLPPSLEPLLPVLDNLFINFFEPMVMLMTGSSVVGASPSALRDLAVGTASAAGRTSFDHSASPRMIPHNMVPRKSHGAQHAATNDGAEGEAAGANAAATAAIADATAGATPGLDMVFDGTTVSRLALHNFLRIYRLLLQDAAVVCEDKAIAAEEERRRLGIEQRNETWFRSECGEILSASGLAHRNRFKDRANQRHSRSSFESDLDDLDAFMDGGGLESPNAMPDPTERPQRTIVLPGSDTVHVEALFLSALASGVGGLVANSEDRHVFGEYLRAICRPGSSESKHLLETIGRKPTYVGRPFPEHGSVFDYLYDVAEGGWVHCDLMVDPSSTIRQARMVRSLGGVGGRFSYSDIFFPNVAAIKHTAVLDLIVRAGEPILLMGPSGSGKTATALNFFRRRRQEEIFGHMQNNFAIIGKQGNEPAKKRGPTEDRMGMAGLGATSGGAAPGSLEADGMDAKSITSTLHVAMTPGIRVSPLLRMIEKRLRKYPRGVLGPPLGTKLVVLIDDLHLSHGEPGTGVQPVVELLRQWLSQGGWYDPQSYELRRINSNVQLVALLTAAGPSVSQASMASTLGDGSDYAPSWGPSVASLRENTGKGRTGGENDGIAAALSKVYGMTRKKWDESESAESFMVHNSKVDNSSHALSARFLRRNYLLYFPPPEAEDLRTVFLAMLTLHFHNFNTMDGTRVASLLEPIAEASIRVAFWCVRELLPVPTRPHYQFQPMRDLLRLAQGMSLLSAKMFNDNYGTLDDVVSLWQHEVARVFGDRIVDFDERDALDILLEDEVNLLDKEIKPKEPFNISTPDEPIMFTNIPNLDEVEVVTLDLDSADHHTAEQHGLYAKSVGGGNGRQYFMVPSMRSFIAVCNTALSRYNSSINKRAVHSHRMSKHTSLAVSLPTPMNLVLFQEAVEHVARIVRALSLDAQHLMLMGRGGTGRRSLTRLAAFIMGYQVVDVDVLPGFTLLEWRDRCKQLVRETGAEGRRTILLFHDPWMQEALIDDLCQLLNSGSILGLFTEEELSQLLTEMSPQLVHEAALTRRSDQMLAEVMANESGEEVSEVLQKVRLDLAQDGEGRGEGMGDALTSDLPEDVLLRRCRQRLRIIMAVEYAAEGSEDGGVLFHRIVRKYPTLIHKTNQVFVPDWSPDSLCSVAQHVLASAAVDPSNLERLVVAAADLHLVAMRHHREFGERCGRFFGVTSTDFFELLLGFNAYHMVQERALRVEKHKYEIGVDKLDATKAMIAEMKAKVEAMQPRFLQMQAETKEVLWKLEQEKLAAEEAKRIQQEEEEALDRESAATQVIRDQCNADLALAMPPLLAVTKELANINKGDIAELKSLKKPPEGVRHVMEAIMVMLRRPLPAKSMIGLPPPNPSDPPPKNQMANWEAAQKVLGDVSFIKQLVNYDREQLTEELISKVKKYVKNPEFDPERVCKVNYAAMSLCKWVTAMYTYHEVTKVVRPKQVALRETEEKLALMQCELEHHRERTNYLISAVAKLEADSAAVAIKLQKLKLEYEEGQEHIASAERLQGAIKEEMKRWQKRFDKLSRQVRQLIGDGLLANAVTAYCGPMNREWRGRLLAAWMEVLKEHRVPVDPEWSIIKVLGDELKIKKWHLAGLPNGDNSVESALIMENSRRWPLILDPEGQAAAWICRLLRSHGVLVLAYGAHDLEAKLHVALQLGLPTLIEKYEHGKCPVVEQLLMQRLFEENGCLYVQLGSSVAPYRDDFQLYLTCQEPPERFTSDLLVKVGVINFSLSTADLTDQLLGLALLTERPDLDKDRHQLALQRVKDTELQRDVERRVLEAVGQAKGNLMSNNTILEILRESSSTNSSVSERMQQASSNQRTIARLRRVYADELVFNAAVVWFTIADLAHVNRAYQYSMRWYLDTFCEALRDAPCRNVEELERRLPLLWQHFMWTVFVIINRSLFDADRAMFSFLLVLRLLEAQHGLLYNDWQLFLGTVVNGTLVGPNKRKGLELPGAGGAKPAADPDKQEGPVPSRQGDQLAAQVAVMQGRNAAATAAAAAVAAVAAAREHDQVGVPAGLGDEPSPHPRRAHFSQDLASSGPSAGEPFPPRRERRSSISRLSAEFDVGDIDGGTGSAHEHKPVQTHLPSEHTGGEGGGGGGGGGESRRERLQSISRVSGDMESDPGSPGGAVRERRMSYSRMAVTGVSERLRAQNPAHPWMPDDIWERLCVVCKRKNMEDLPDHVRANLEPWRVFWCALRGEEYILPEVAERRSSRRMSFMSGADTEGISPAGTPRSRASLRSSTFAALQEASEHSSEPGGGEGGQGERSSDATSSLSSAVSTEPSARGEQNARSEMAGRGAASQQVLRTPRASASVSARSNPSLSPLQRSFFGGGGVEDGKFPGAASVFQPGIQTPSTPLTTHRTSLQVSRKTFSLLPLPWRARLNSFERLLVAHALCPERLHMVMKLMVAEQLGDAYLDPVPSDLNSVYCASSAITPVAFFLFPGSNPVPLLQAFADSKSRRLDVISLGQGQSALAEARIEQLCREGRWLLLQNCHLVPTWMPKLLEIIQGLEKRAPIDPQDGTSMAHGDGSSVRGNGDVRSLRRTTQSHDSRAGQGPPEVNPHFRLWLSFRVTAEIPTAMLRACVHVVDEPPSSLNANIRRSMAMLTRATHTFQREMAGSATWQRLLLGLCVFHAVVLERRRFGTLGWNAPYEFSDSDLEVSVLQCRTLFQAEGLASVNEPRASRYLDTVRYLIAEVFYGGHVTDPRDRQLLLCLLDDCLGGLTGSSHASSEGVDKISGNITPGCGPDGGDPGAQGNGHMARGGEEDLRSALRAAAEGRQYKREEELTMASVMATLPTFATFTEFREHVERFNPKDAALSLIGLHPNALEAHEQAGARYAMEVVTSLQLRSYGVSISSEDRNATIMETINDILAALPTHNLASAPVLGERRLSMDSMHREQAQDLRRTSISKRLRAGLMPGGGGSSPRMLVREMEEEALTRLVELELYRYAALVDRVRLSLVTLWNGINGMSTMTKELEAIQASLFEATVPRCWAQYPSDEKLAGWVLNLRERHAFMVSWVYERPPVLVELRHFLYPHNFLATLLQIHARRQCVAVETLRLRCHVMPRHADEVASLPGEGCYIAHNHVTSARWNEEEACLDEPAPGVLHELLPTIWLCPEKVQAPAPTVSGSPMRRNSSSTQVAANKALDGSTPPPAEGGAQVAGAAGTAATRAGFATSEIPSPSSGDARDGGKPVAAADNVSAAAAAGAAASTSGIGERAPRPGAQPGNPGAPAPAAPSLPDGASELAQGSTVAEGASTSSRVAGDEVAEGGGVTGDKEGEGADGSSGAQGQAAEEAPAAEPEPELPPPEYTFECPVFMTSRGRANMTNIGSMHRQGGGLADFVTYLGLPSRKPPERWIKRGVVIICHDPVV